MTELFQTLPVKDALKKFKEHLKITPKTESIELKGALDRVLATSQKASENIPGFIRSSMDGYAVLAQDTHGASASQPAWLKVVGELVMGKPATLTLNPGEAVLVHTGGMVPEGADAVVMVEHTRKVAQESLEIYRPVAVGENLIQQGEDLKKGQTLFEKGKRLRPQDIGALAAMGISKVEVCKRPKVAILSQGDELVNVDQNLQPGQVRDINSFTLAGQVVKAGGEPLTQWGILPDKIEALRTAAKKAQQLADVIVFSAGSSVGSRDLTAQVIQEMGSPGILVHGLAIKPGKPTIMALAGNQPIFGLPGNPVSAMVTFQLVVAPTLAWLLGTNPSKWRSQSAILSRNVASQSGREDYVPVGLEERDGDVVATPIFGKSNLITTLAKADGLIQIPLDKNGLSQGEMVEVFPF